jgi:hypothetical protein
MFDVNDDAKGGFRRSEMLTGPGSRRRWSPEEKARIVEETLVPATREFAGRVDRLLPCRGLPDGRLWGRADLLPSRNWPASTVQTIG